MSAYTLVVTVLALGAGLQSDARFQEGVRQRAQFEYEASLATFEALLASDPDRAAEERALLHLYVGVLHAELRRPGAAKESFARALDLEPLSVMPVEVSPPIAALFAESQAAANEPRAPAAVVPEARAREPAPQPAPEDAPTVNAPATEEPVAASPPTVLPIAILAAGGVVVVLGGGLWGAGVWQFVEAQSTAFQSDKVSANERAALLQVSGQIATGVGAGIAILGAAWALAE